MNLTVVLLFALGLVLLIKGGDWFVDGSVGIAELFHIPELLIGATVVSIGTTLPEVMVSSASALTGHGEIAYGNAVGSVICNTALIASITLVFRPGTIHKDSLKLMTAFFFGAAAIYLLTAYVWGSFSRVSGIILLAVFLVYIILSVRQARSAVLPEPPEDASEEEKTHEPLPLKKALPLLIIGAAAIAFGADLLVDNGTLIAEAIGVPESVIGLTMIALGTSLPELITAITSLIRGHSSLSLGNIIGANLFNLVLVSGISATLSPFDVPVSRTIAGYNASLVMDMPIMVGVMLILTVPALIKGRLYRWQGILLLLIYVAFCAAQYI